VLRAVRQALDKAITSGHVTVTTPPRCHRRELAHLSADLHAILHAAMQVESPLFKYRAGPYRRNQQDGLLFTAVGPNPDPERWEATVWMPIAPEAFLARAAAFFGEGQPYSVALEVGPTQALEDALRERNWQLDEEEPAMVLSPIPTRLPPPPDELKFSLVSDDTSYADFFTVSATRQVPSLAAATAPGVALLVGYVDGKPVTTGRLSVLDHVGDITSIATLESYRRRGYGGAMTFAVAAEAERRGCASAILSATEMGYPLYMKLGFQPVCVYRTYVPPEL
jgi:ribosomal protein S18 acetylase RimI-like enzyme